MGIIVISSNYLVQFPVKFYGLDNLLTYGAFSYPVTFLITDLANRAFGKQKARYVVLIGFIVGIFLTLFVSTNFEDIISIRIAIGSATAFIIAQNLDVNIFDLLEKNLVYRAHNIFNYRLYNWHFYFFSIAFYGTDIPWLTLAFGDLAVNLILSLIMLITFRIFINRINDFTNLNIKNFNY